MQGMLSATAFIVPEQGKDSVAQWISRFSMGPFMEVKAVVQWKKGQ